MQAELEKWIAGHEAELYAHKSPNCGPIVWAIPTSDLRALLEGKVLCEKEPVAWRTFDGEGNWDLRSYEYNETYHADYIKLNGEKYADWVLPLYAPADINKTPAVPNGEYEPEYRSGIRDCNDAMPRPFC